MSKPLSPAVSEFAQETSEFLEQLDLLYLNFESSVVSADLLNEIFRILHTIKGNSGFLSFKRYELITNSLESLVDLMRSGKKEASPYIGAVLLQANDYLKALLLEILSSNEEPAGESNELLSLITHCLSSDAELAQDLTSSPAKIEFVSKSLTPGSPKPEIEENLPSPLAKVDLGLLDRLMALVSELVLARNRLQTYANDSFDLKLSNTVRSLDNITSELQEGMLMTRMAPIGQLFSKFPRVVRDIARECGKQVELVQSGAETELDRSLIDVMRDPLVHLLRNSIDHGIEMPDERVKADKPEKGTIFVSASHENGIVLIEIVDDGRGIDLEKVKSKALEKGLVTAESLEKMSQKEVLDLVFLPGFSTKSEITNLSGRGVGMDVVKTKIKQIRGNVNIETNSSGTRIKLSIPLTVAIMPAVFVKTSGQLFAIPQTNVIEMVAIQNKDGQLGVEDFYGVKVFRLRDQLIPLVDIAHVLKISKTQADVSVRPKNLNIVVVNADGNTFGIIVDQILFMQEIVVKPLGEPIAKIKYFAGATILGDGNVAIIIDINGLASESGLRKHVQENQNFAIPKAIEASAADTHSNQFLLFNLEITKNLAIQLIVVERLDYIKGESISYSGDVLTTLYSGQIIQLIDVSEVIDDQTTQYLNETEYPVILFYYQNQLLGLIVNSVKDIVTLNSELVLLKPAQKGIIGSMELDSKIINVINLDQILSIKGMSELYDIRLISNDQDF